MLGLRLARAVPVVASTWAATCGDPVPAPQVKPNDHYVCVEIEADTDVPSQEEVPEPFGDTGAIEGTGAADETGSMAGDEDNLAYTRGSAEADGSKGRGAVPNGSRDSKFRSTVKCKSTSSLGHDDIWDHSRIDALTYCFGTFMDPELEAAVRNAIGNGTWEYELVADVNFVHVPELDGTGCDHDADVTFVVRQGIEPDDCYAAVGCPLARAFFPSEADSGNAQDVVFFPQSLVSDMASLEGITQHEFGHTLGLHHEHARYVQQDGTLSFNQEFACVGSSGPTSSWRGITPPDPNSIMGYPYCRGTPGATATLSRFDKLGLRYLYNLPALTIRSFDQDTTEDIFWYSPASESISVWYGMQTEDQIQFMETTFCWDASAPPACTTTVPSGLRPIPISANGSTNVLMYGPGAISDQLFLMQVNPGEPDRFAVAIGLRTAVPRTGSFMATDGTDDVLFTLPGPGNSDLGLAEGISSFQTYDLVEGAEGYFDAAIGRFVDRNGIIGDQILWYADHSPAWTLTYRTEGGGIQEESIDPDMCGLSEPSSLNAIVGNFDDDQHLEILWYDYEQESAILWTSIDDCGANREVYVVEGRPKPYPGDFDGDGRLDVAWDRPGPDDEIWIFTSIVNPLIASTTLPSDTAPAVGDFNGDECADILWHRSHTPTSHLWRSLCDGTFDASVVDTPQNSTAIGYTFAHGRAYR